MTFLYCEYCTHFLLHCGLGLRSGLDLGLGFWLELGLVIGLVLVLQDKTPV